MASRNVPVRDELVLNIGDVFPMLKSGEGIPVVKHTKRGQNDPRRLRLDTDDSTLEVFRQSTTASFLNRKISNKTYYLRTLKEVRASGCYACSAKPHSTACMHACTHPNPKNKIFEELLGKLR